MPALRPARYQDASCHLDFLRDIVENRAGGNGIIGADAVAKSAADGYTLLFNASTFVTAPMTMKAVPYKVQTDFFGGVGRFCGAFVHGAV